MKKILQIIITCYCLIFSVQAQDPAYPAPVPSQPIVKAEYYFDNLVDFGSGFDIPVATATTVDVENFEITTSGLSDGFHRLYVRTKTDDGKWSITNQKQFYVYSDPAYPAANPLHPIVKAEYFFDNAIDFGGGFDIPVGTGTAIYLQDFTIITNGLSDGFHRLYVRTKTDDGKWSITNQKQFYVYNDPAYSVMNILQPIVKAEYYFDGLTDFGNGTDIPLTTTGTNIDLHNLIINTDGLSTGVHHLYIRTKDVNGRWSITNQRTITVEPFQPYVDFQNSEFYIKPAGTLIPSGQTLAAFDYSTALSSHAIFNDGIYFPKVDHLGNNIWLRVRHIADDPNGISVGYNITKTASSPFRLNGFGGWWGFLYQFDVYKDINITGVPGYMLDGLFPVNILVESIETLSPQELISFENINSESSNWGLNTISFSGNNLNSNPGFSATNNAYSNLTGFTSLFPAASKNIYAVDKGSYPGYAEFRMSADNLSQFKYGYEYPDAGGYQGIRIYMGLPARPSNEDCSTATTLTPSADISFTGNAGTLNYATASSFLDCDHKQNADVWYKFTATAKYHRIVLKNAVKPDSMRFQLYGGNCSSFYTIACVLNSRDTVVYDATDLRIGETYYLRVYSMNSFTSNGNFDIGIVSPPLFINKGLNILTNASFEMPAITVQAQNMGNTITPWANKSLLNMALIREVSYAIVFGPDTSSSGSQHLDMLGFNDTLYQHFSIANTTTLFFSGHFSNQAAQYPSENYQPWTGFCGILDENNVLVAKSDIMNFTNKLTDKVWYQLSGTAYDLPPGNYKYIAYVSNYTNFDNAFLQANATVNCPIVSQPPTSVSSNDADNTICNGSAITLTANGAVPASGGSYAWYEGGCANGLSIGSGPTLTLIPSIGIHNYYVLVQEVCGYTDCATIGITVIPPLPVSIIISTTANVTSLCEATVVTFTATTTNTYSIATYQWKINGQYVGSNQPSFTSTNLAGNDVITCTVITFCGAEITSNSITITGVYPVLNNTISITSSATTTCAGSYVSFVATAPYVGYNPVRYKWKKNGIIVSDINLTFPSTTIFNTSNYDTYNIVNNDVITCEVTSSTPCTLPATAVSNAITMTVLPENNTSVSIAITTGSNPDCSGGPLTFTATPTNGGTTPTYEWHRIAYFPAYNTIVGSNSPTLTLQNPEHNDTYYCNMTSSIVCASPPVASSNSITVKAPTVLTGNINGSPNMSTCGSATVTFYAISWNVINGFSTTNNSPSYQWKLNGNNVGPNSSTYSQTGFTQGDVITCTVSSTEPCASPASLDLSMTVSVYDVSSATFSIASGPTTLCAGIPAEFYAQPINAGANPSYQWKLNGNDVTVATYGYYILNNPTTGDVVTCIMTTDATCGTPITIPSSNSITINNIIQLSTPTISIVAAQPLNSPANNFIAIITNGGSNPIYHWKKNGLDVGFNSNTYLDFSLLNADVITCTLESDLPCASPSIVTSNSMTVQPLSYCIPNTIYGYTACELAWISNVVLGTTINKSSGCAGFYTDYTTTDTLKTNGGQTINFVITESTDGNNFGMYSNIYIDYNRDGDFTDPDEKVTADIFTSLGGAAAGTFVVPVFIVPGSYRMRVMLNSHILNECELGFGEAEDYILQITQPDYCIPVISSPCDMWISNVTIGTINNSSVQPTNCIAGGYIDYSSLFSTSAGPGQTVSFSIAAGNNFQYADIYIDYNSDGDFNDAGEWVAQNLYMDIFGGNATGSFIVPVTQAYGFYRIRIRSHAYDINNPLSLPGACDNYLTGETEDYTLVITCIPNGSDVVVKGNNVVITDGDNTPDIADSTDFGNILINTILTRTFFIENPGTVTLNISAVTITGVNASNFTVVNQPAVSIVAGGNTSFTIQFNPGYLGIFNAVMHINTDNCDKKDYDIAIQGTSVCPVNGPEINVQGNGLDIVIYDNSPDIADNTDFGTVTANNTLSKTFTIQNNGNLPLNIATVEFYNYDVPNQFVVSSQPATTVAVGVFTTFTVQFTPTGSGQRNAWIRILSNDCDESYYAFLLTGNAECPALIAEVNVKGNGIDIIDGDNTPADADYTNFGLAALNASVSKSFVVENNGVDPMNISGVTFTGIGAADFSITTAPAATVAPGSSTLFTVQFLSTVSGLKSAIMHINNSDCDEGDYDIAISGTDGTVCTPVISQQCYMYISNVTIGSINNNSACSYGIGYSDYTATLSNVAAPGGTVQFSASAYGNEQKVNVYIDYNKDGDFVDAGELVLNDLYMSPDVGNGIINATGSFVVPQTQAPDNYRVRIISQWNNENTLTPCYTNYGEAEDYTLVVQSSTSITVNLKAFLQGYYTGSQTMQPVLNNQTVLNSLPNETDTITVELHDPTTYALVNSKNAVLLTDGTVSVAFSQTPGTYYIAIKHRNSIQTWSANPVSCPTQTTYDFTIASSKAMGDNQAEVEQGVWAFFTGDLNQDDFIDGNDFPAFDTDSFNGVNSVYVATDMNGDGFVDGNDFPVFDNNSFNGVSSIHP